VSDSINRTKHEQRIDEKKGSQDDQQLQPVKFSVGQWVSIKAQGTAEGTSGYGSMLCAIPLLIIGFRPPEQVTLQKSNGGYRFAVELDKIEPYIGETPASWLEPEAQLAVELEQQSVVEDFICSAEDELGAVSDDEQAGVSQELSDIICDDSGFASDNTAGDMVVDKGLLLQPECRTRLSAGYRD